MRESLTSGSVGRAPGNRCLYPEADSVASASYSHAAADFCVFLKVNIKKTICSHINDFERKGEGRPNIWTKRSKC